MKSEDDQEPMHGLLLLFSFSFFSGNKQCERIFTSQENRLTEQNLEVNGFES